MAFTDHCEIFGAILDSGVNRVVRHVTRQRPSLFNYGTQALLRRPDLLCREIDVHPVVIERGNPIIGVQPALPIVGSGGLYGLDYCLQLAIAEVDFSPGNVIALPPQLNPPLADQRFALHGAVCAGLGCPPDEIVDRLPPVPPQRGKEGGLGLGAEIVIPSRQLQCFCLELFGVGGIDFTGPAMDQRVQGKLDGLELVDLSPEGLENSIECYAELVIKLVLLPQLAVPTIRFTQDLMGLASVTVFPTPTSATLPNNPALEENQLKVFIDVTAGESESGPPSGPPSCEPGEEDGGDGGSPPAPTLIDRPRVRTGPADATVAVAEVAVRELFNAVRDGFRFEKCGGGDFGPFTLNYAVAAHLEGGTIDLRDDNAISIRELDVRWDQLELCLELHIDPICTPDCLIPNPLDGCLVPLPHVCLFEGDPDLRICLDIGGALTSEISGAVRPIVKYAIDPGRTPAMNDWDALDAGVPNKWQIRIDPEELDFDLIDVADTVGNLLDAAIDAFVDGLLGGLPDEVKDFIRSVLGPVANFVRDLLDLGDDIEEWITEKLGVSLGLFDFLLMALADYFRFSVALAEIPDPFEALPADGGLIPVLVPIEFLGVRVNSDELIAEIDVGG